MRRTSIVNNDYPLSALLLATASGGSAPFGERLAEFLGVSRCYLTSCGFSALGVYLRALKEGSPGKDEVVIPAYAAPGLVLPVQASGLRVRLCDISPETFLLDENMLGKSVGARTLAVIPAHMFGIPFDIAALAARAGNDFTVIDDAAQALGSEIGGKKAGGITGAGFGSFGRGKNFSLYHGGFIAVSPGPLADAIEKQYLLLPVVPRARQFSGAAKHLLFSLATHPFGYVLASPLLSPLKSTRERTTFSSGAMGALTERYAGPQFDVWLSSYRRRIENGAFLHRALSGLPGITLPRLAENSRTAFNRLPVVVHDPVLRQRLFAALEDRGIEASVMYGKPVHRLWNLGYRDDEFPCANYLADHLLTLPVHGNVSEGDRKMLVEVFSRTCTTGANT